MKNVVTIILMLVGLVTLVAPECPGPVATENSIQLSSSSLETTSSPVSHSDTNSNSDSHDHHDCNDCGTDEHGCHQCHFGHCGAVVAQHRISPLDKNSEFSHFYQNLNLKSFIASLFRPPIA